jgi:CRP-like cAMP-binding protein
MTNTQNALFSLFAQMQGAGWTAQAKHLSLETNARLQAADEPIEYVYFPLSCVVSLVRDLENGDTVECGVVGQNGILGGGLAFDVTVAHIRAIVQVPGAAIRISKPHFTEACDAHPELRIAIARYFAGQLAESQQMIACNAVHHIEQRLCRWLLQMRDQAGQKRLPLKQEFVAQMLGVQRTSVTLAESNLEKAGILKIGRGWVEIIDDEKAQARACECYQSIRKLQMSYGAPPGGARNDSPGLSPPARMENA